MRSTLGVTLALLGPAAGSAGHLGCARGQAPPATYQVPAQQEQQRQEARLPAELTVTNPDGRPWPRALVQGGFAFPRGAVHDAQALTVECTVGGPLVLQARPLAFWSDGSIKWAELTFYVSSLGANERRVLRVDSKGRDRPDPAGVQAVVRGDEFTVVLRDDEGQSGFRGADWTSVASGAIYVESSCQAPFEDREGSTNGRLSAARFPELRAVRYRFGLKQLANGATWRGLEVVVPHRAARVERGSELGAAVSDRGSGGQVVTLLAGADPVDAGTGRQWEIWGYEDPAAFPRSPLVPTPSPAYLRATQALGRFVIDAPPAWRDNFHGNYRSVFSKLAGDARTSGWRNWGALLTRKESEEYLGYYNQEYDPATALFLAYASTGRSEYLETARDLAGFYRDMLVSPEGGCYQHRAPLNALKARVVAVVAEGMAAQIRARSGDARDDRTILDYAREVFGDRGEEGARKALEGVKDRSFEERLAAVCGHAATRVLEPKLLGLKHGKKGVKGAVEELTRDPELRRFGLVDADAAFRPFFERYGGSWSDLPAFHVDLSPSPAWRHSGSHSLVEMLVLAYFLGGDESFRETALRVARNQLEDVIPRAVDMVEESLASRQPVLLREVAWPLINLLALEELTERRDLELNGRIRREAGKLARLITRVPPERVEGSVHAGISSEALARYHERTGDAEVGDYLVRFTRYWARTQWNGEKGEFFYRHGVSETNGTWSNGINVYGMAYSQDLSADPALRSRVQEAYRPLVTTTASDGKDFAQKYRSTWRALDMITARKD